MSIEVESKEKSNRWLYGVIALLLFLLIAETGFLLFKQFQKPEGEEMRPAVTRQTYRPLTSAYDQPSPLPRLRQAPSPSSTTPSGASPDTVGADPFEELDRMHERMNHLFNSLAFNFGPSWFQNVADQELYDFAPAIDLQETEKAYIVQGDLPGLVKDKINVTVKDNVLTLQGVREAGSETQDERTGYYAQERSYGSFARSLTLPGPVDEANVKAEYKDGVLTVTLPKVGNTKNIQRVNIQ